jgi:cell wall-associated NlpC family hydrolase
MRRFSLVIAVLMAAAAGSAQAATFTVVPGEVNLPSFDVPNGPGDITPPPQISTPPAVPQVLTYPELLSLWQEAGEAYDIPWEVLASINEIESGFGRGMGPSSAGAIGWMQFLPSTWEGWGVDANGDGIADPWNATDAVYAAARYLAAAGAHEDLPRAIFAYNHAQWYVDDVLAGAARFAVDPLAPGLLLSLQPAGPSIEDLERELEEARTREVQFEDELAGLESELEQVGWALTAAERKAGNPSLSDAAFARAESAVSEVTAERESIQDELGRVALDLAQAGADVLRLEQDLVVAKATAGSNDLGGLLPPAPTPAAGAVIDYALSHLGLPYHWGGNHGYSLEQMVTAEPSLAYGFDCSSLLSWSYANGAGMYIGDWTGSQWEYGLTAPGASRGPGPAQGGDTPPGGYLPGDLIFFNATNHVGLYIGNDLFVHAPHTGDVVKISRLSEYGPVWGWVRYSQVSGLEPLEAAVEPVADRTMASLAAGDDVRIFTVVASSDATGEPAVTFDR